MPTDTPVDDRGPPTRRTIAEVWFATVEAAEATLCRTRIRHR
jgi:hypothetical protein